MSRTLQSQVSSLKPAIRCAIYTRKSTEEGLEQEFNSLDAQRESGEAYIASQKNEGWVCLPDRYNDGGFTGGNMERPGLTRLLRDIEAGKVDCVVVYKVDRLSRSLLDFARMMETFDTHNVSFVSVTQHFNTTDSMGRLTLNVLLSFAQFEREIISERTRDKIAAARRKGKWVGGRPILGYDVDPNRARLVVNPAEAERVRAIFRLYLEQQSLIRTAAELNTHGWTAKRWTTRKGQQRGGRPWDKASVLYLLRNVAYAGKVRYKDEVHGGEHERIVDEALWQQVNRTLRANGRSGGMHVRNKYGALLKGLLHCAPCGRAMGHSYTVKNGNRAYRYYVCYAAQKKGWAACPSKSLPAEQIERFVVDQIRAIGRDPTLVAVTAEQARAQEEERISALESERRKVERELTGLHAKVRRVNSTGRDGEVAAHLADLHDRTHRAEQRLTEVQNELADVEQRLVGRDEAETALCEFDGIWDALSPREQVRIVHNLVGQVAYDGQNGKLAITFHPSGIRTLQAGACRPETGGSP